MFVLSLLYMSRVFVLFVTNFTISKNKLFEKIFKNNNMDLNVLNYTFTYANLK